MAVRGRESNPAMEGYGRRATRQWRVAGGASLRRRARAESDPVIGRLRHRANRRRAGQGIERPCGERESSSGRLTG
jgi:hypothetical protein